MAPLRSNLVQYSPYQAEEAARAVSDIDFTFTKHFQDGLLTLLSDGCLNHFLVPVHQMPIAQTVLTSPLSMPLCSGPVSSAGDGSSCDLSPVFRISDTSVLRVREYSVFTGQTLADCKLVKLTKLKFFSTLKTIPICHLSLSRINLRIQLSEWHHIAFNSSFFSTSSYF